MSELIFITGNKNKLNEVKNILVNYNITNLKLDLPEIQSDDPKEIIKEKLLYAKTKTDKPFICEDTSLEFDCLNGLPGPFIKFFLHNLKPDGLYELTNKYNNHQATARTIIGLYHNNQEHYFEGAVKGTITKPTKEAIFGWDPIFKPDGYNETYAEMDKEVKNSMSHRRLAIDKLNDYLKQNNF